MLKVKRLSKKILKPSTFLVVALVFGFFLMINKVNKNYGVENYYPSATSFERKDWHDWKFIDYEKSRNGPGEQGTGIILKDLNYIKLNEKLFQQEGLYALISDLISVNRSVPDVRPEQCKNIRYLKNLPKVSVIVIFHNEYSSILYRTVHSIINRSPRELIKEIILVNDASTKHELYEPLENYMRENFHCVKIIHLKERKGLIVARMVGARAAKEEVLVFLDAHTEMNVNWLPPLLEPIAIHPKTCTTPRVDTLDARTFEYKRVGVTSRGIFGWNFHFRWLPRLPEDMVFIERPAPNPIMLGCAFAIRRDYFFDLGGYDEGLMIWNGEHYELSLKLWLCGGKLLEVPCSRIGHMFRVHNNHRIIKSFDFVTYNFKRVAEVWLDDYKKYLYKTNPKAYQEMDPGDLTKAKLIKKNLKCRSFDYFLDQVAPDMLTRYPFNDPGSFAKGAIKSESNESLCVDALALKDFKEIGLFDCSQNLSHLRDSQNFVLSWHRQIKLNNLDDLCLSAGSTRIESCHFKFGDQLWFYDQISHQIRNLPTNNCLSSTLPSKSISMATCDVKDKNQKWIWGYVNKTALDNWETFGVQVKKS